MDVQGNIAHQSCQKQPAMKNVAVCTICSCLLGQQRQHALWGACQQPDVALTLHPAQAAASAQTGTHTMQSIMTNT